MNDMLKDKKENDADWPTKYDIENMQITGFIAQEVEQAAHECGYDFSGVQKAKDQNGVYSISYAQFVVPLVKAVQEQQEIIRQLQQKIRELEKQIQEIKQTNKP